MLGLEMAYFSLMLPTACAVRSAWLPPEEDSLDITSEDMDLDSGPRPKVLKCRVQRIKLGGCCSIWMALCHLDCFTLRHIALSNQQRLNIPHNSEQAPIHSIAPTEEPCKGSANRTTHFCVPALDNYIPSLSLLLQRKAGGFQTAAAYLLGKRAQEQGGSSGGGGHAVQGGHRRGSPWAAGGLAGRGRGGRGGGGGYVHEDDPRGWNGGSGDSRRGGWEQEGSARCAAAPAPPVNPRVSEFTFHKNI